MGHVGMILKSISIAILSSCRIGFCVCVRKPIEGGQRVA